MLEAAVQKPPQPKSGVYRIGPPGCDVGRFLSLYCDWLEKMLVEHQPQGIAFESPILPKTTNPATARKLMGLAGNTQMMAFDFRIRWVREVQPSTAKLHISGHGGPGKQRVKDAISSRGWTYQSDDEADALSVWDWAAHQYARERQAA